MSEQELDRRDCYVARQGPTWQTTTWGVGCTVVGGLVIGFGSGTGAVVAAVAIWLLGALIAGMPVVRRGRVAVSVDARGIELGMGRKLFLPWPQVIAIVELRSGRSRWLGVQPVPGAEIPRRPGRATQAVNRMFTASDVPAEAVDFSIPIQGWKLDRAALAAAVQTHAQHVELRLR
ncbi:hypothetical protein MOQ72_32780 [Saccharopolyspora sp. K220]|uniref:hypothetical protein n=1 Tax=Saccharopolyspora soli TaxID=2926618 RepID=UPI001F59F029|nr:hypothetical protein [Saccharopolyspora soli]MCI2422218.1 hypothetical protein [Saccharopolyspora soli]